MDLYSRSDGTRPRAGQRCPGTLPACTPIFAARAGTPPPSGRRCVRSSSWPTVASVRGTRPRAPLRARGGPAPATPKILVFGTCPRGPGVGRFAAAEHGGGGHGVHDFQVPVLSLLMTVVPPRVSTSLSDLTTALCSGQPPRPRGQHGLHNVGRPVGIAAIAVGMHNSTKGGDVLASHDTEDGDDRHGRERDHADLLGGARAAGAAAGVRVRLVAVTIPAVYHLDVAAGGGRTGMVAVPRVTWVFWNTGFVRWPAQPGPGRRRGVLWVSSAAARSARPAAALAWPRIRSARPPGRVPGIQQHDVTRHQRR